MVQWVHSPVYTTAERDIAKSTTVITFVMGLVFKETSDCT